MRSSPAGALDYSSITQKPIRGALVQAINPATNGVYASTSTDENGFYSVAVPASVNVQVIVNAQLLRDPTGPAPRWSIAVRDNTQSDAIYALGQTCNSGAAGNTACNLRAASGWNGTSYATTRAAGPFSILDTAYAAVQRVLQANSTATFPSLNMFWSVNNRPAAQTQTCGLAQGCIGTSFYGGSSGGVHRLFILGAANTDTDEYDVHVVAHEWGHYFQGAFSRDDSPGGSHTGNELQDFRLAFSEGWGNAWSGMVWNDPIYRDSLGANQGGGFAVNVSRRTGTGAAGDTRPAGWFREDTVQYVLWSLYDQLGRNGAGFSPIFTAMTNTAFVNGTPLTGIHNFAKTLRDAVGAGSAAATTLAPILTDQGIATAADALGVGETNSAGQTGVLPIYTSYTTLNTNVQVCVNNANGTGNKLRNFAYVNITVPATRNYTITVTDVAPTPASDPDFSVFQGRRVADALSAVAGSETLSGVALQAGNAVVVLDDYNLDSSAPASTQRCFNINVN
ncbi:hypothetical protein [Piscinibacterium candidicorallinum]|uniref:Lipoprotein n=1 Tax=Piscinibacterium candidicorallinum TaxID=1793872 RepID=A0ABV7H507_9BURK